MSAGLLVGCPGCGHEFVVRVEPLGGPSAVSRQPSTADPPARDSGQGTRDSGAQLEVAFSDENGWEMKCPNHDWHAAREFPASGRDGAVIKCTGKTAGKWCDVRVPLEVARRRAGIGR